MKNIHAKEDGRSCARKYANWTIRKSRRRCGTQDEHGWCCYLPQCQARGVGGDYQKHKIENLEKYQKSTTKMNQCCLGIEDFTRTNVKPYQKPSFLVTWNCFT